MNFSRLFVSTLFGFLLLVNGPAYADLTPAQRIVSDFQQGLLEVMKNADKTSVQQRYTALQPRINRSFHLPLMARIATGKYWSAATKAEKQNLINAFRRMSTATLATLFDGYSGEIFKQVTDKPGPQKTRLVVTKLIKSDKTEIRISYVMRNFSEGWRIIDVILDDGISELMVRRSEYKQVLKKSGISGLIDLLDNKADELLSPQ